MYARITTFKVDPARLDELATKIGEMAPRAKMLPGLLDAYCSWRGDGKGVMVAVYRSKADADAAVGRIQALFGSVVGLLSSAPDTDTYENVAHITG